MYQYYLRDGFLLRRTRSPEDTTDGGRFDPDTIDTMEIWIPEDKLWRTVASVDDALDAIHYGSNASPERVKQIIGEDAT